MNLNLGNVAVIADQMTAFGGADREMFSLLKLLPYFFLLHQFPYHQTSEKPRGYILVLSKNSHLSINSLNILRY